MVKQELLLYAGKLNAITKEDLNEILRADGDEQLFYKAFPINVALLRGTYSDENGNLMIDYEIGNCETVQK